MSDEIKFLAPSEIPSESDLGSLDKIAVANFFKQIANQQSCYLELDERKKFVDNYHPILHLFNIVNIALLIIFPPLLLIVAFFQWRSYKKKYDEYKIQVDNFYTTGTWAKDREEFTNKITNLFGPMYANPMAILSFASYFENGRCSNLQEAKNLYETELSQLRMESKLDEAVAQAQAASKAAKSASNSAGFAGTMSFFNLLKK